MDILMKIKSRLHINAPLLLFLVSLIDFLVYYIINMWFWEYDTALYVAYFIGRVFDFAIPVLAAALLLTRERSIPKSILWAFLYSLPRLVYVIPYYYLRYVYDIYDSIEAISIAIPLSLLVIIILSLKVLLFYTVIKLFIRRAGKCADELFPLRPFDLDNPAVIGILICSFINFLVNVGFEIYDTVLFFIDAGMSYKSGEILFIVLSYVILVIAFILTHIAASFFANLIKKRSIKFKEDSLTANEN